MSDAKAISLAVWDVPMPVVAGERFTINAGAKDAAGGRLAGKRVEVSDAGGNVVASATFSDTPLPGTEALYWTTLDVPAPAKGQADYTVQSDGAMATRFSVIAAAKPAHTVTIKVTERDSAETLDGVEVRLGPFRGRTDKAGRASLRVAAGEYQLHLWRTAHVAAPQPVRINGDVSIDLTMVHVPEEHPDARWVR